VFVVEGSLRDGQNRILIYLNGVNDIPVHSFVHGRIEIKNINSA
jgi:hypothetical protein